MTINEFVDAAFLNAKQKGFHDKKSNVGERIALIHAEVSEALEADREDSYCTVDPSVILQTLNVDTFEKNYKKHVKGTFEEEMADIVIRVFDLCGEKKIDLEGHIIAKMRFNKYRKHKHGKKY